MLQKIWLKLLSEHPHIQLSQKTPVLEGLCKDIIKHCCIAGCAKFDLGKVKNQENASQKPPL